MKRLFRYVCVLLAAFTLLSLVTVAGAAGTQVIDVSHTSAGYVTVSYTSTARLKVGIQYGSGKTAYRDCPSGTTSFALDQGNGTYTVSVCQNLSGTSYRVVASQTMRVTIDSANAPYLISTSEVPFAAGDAVTTKAAELCKNAKTDEQKVVAIYNFIAGRYTYDQALADRITSGQVKSYIPSPTATLSGTKGICYDFASLFAAMCRSQNIPCALTKGYAGNSYHAWNKVDSCFSFQGKFFHFLTINRHRKIEYDLLYPASVFPFLREHLNSLDKGLHKLLLLRFRCGMVDFIKCQQQAIDIVSGNLLLLDAADLTLQFANLNFDFLYGVILLIIAALKVQNLSVIVGIIDVQGIHLTLQAAFRSKGLL